MRSDLFRSRQQPSEAGRSLPERGWLCAAVLALTLLFTGCNSQPQPTGQVVAVADGVEITLAELNEEARARGLAIAANRPLRDALIQELIDRKLLVREAQQQGFDESPQYLLANRRINEILLAQQLLATAAQAWTPSEEEVQQYIASHPQAFDRRALIIVDQIMVPRSLPAEMRRALLVAPSVAAMKEMLNSARIESHRSTQNWDTATMPNGWSNALLSLQPGQSFVLPHAGGFVVGKLVARMPQPLPAAERPQVAREGLIRERTEAILKRLVQEQRSGAEIRYQREFAPERR